MVRRCAGFLLVTNDCSQAPEIEHGLERTGSGGVPDSSRSPNVESTNDDDEEDVLDMCRRWEVGVVPSAAGRLERAGPTQSSDSPVDASKDSPHQR
jgi:hypothetical protein